MVTKTSHLPIRYFMALLWAHPILHFSRIRVNDHDVKDEEKVSQFKIITKCNGLSALFGFMCKWTQDKAKILWRISYKYINKMSIIIIIIIIIIVIIILIIIIIIISFMQGIYTYIHETNYVPREYSVATILLLLFMVLISLVSVWNLLYFYISTFRRMCAVHNMVVFCSSLTSWFPGMLLTYFLNDFEIVPVAPIITGIILFLHSPYAVFLL